MKEFTTAVTFSILVMVVSIRLIVKDIAADLHTIATRESVVVTNTVEKVVYQGMQWPPPAWAVPPYGGYTNAVLTNWPASHVYTVQEIQLEALKPATIIDGDKK